MQRRRNATEYPQWMQMAVQLTAWVALALLVPLLLGVLFDYLTGLSPLGLLLGVGVGMLIALVIVLRTVQHRIMILAPPVDTEDAKENS